MPRTVALVGHCGIDGPRLKRDITDVLSDVEVTRINSTADLESSLRQNPDLLLVNREPVGFDGEGIDLVRQICRCNPGAKVMLISDFAEAQEEAVNAGALPGFGKQLLGSRTVAEKVKQALGD